jgi:hypothetical protein
MRSRRLNGNPLGGWGKVAGWQLVISDRWRFGTRMVLALVVLRSFKRPWCGVQASCSPVPTARCAERLSFSASVVLA